MKRCNYCSQAVVKAGQRKDGTQKYQCKGCKKYQQKEYQYRACEYSVSQKVASLLVEGVGIRGIARVLGISVTTVIERIKRIAMSIRKSCSNGKNGVYEIDELWTYVGSKRSELWITYSFDRRNKAVIDFTVGARTKENLDTVTKGVLALNPVKVCTDGLPIYRNLIPKCLHHVGLPNTRHIERFNLTLRMHLKRLARKTICFSRSKEMLEACLKIYFWSGVEKRSGLVQV
ncbi:MAG: IS1 family transposase [Bacteroidetes bacterium]|nr:IS1 family transposase [Bacteroidota bacterium]